MVYLNGHPVTNHTEATTLTYALFAVFLLYVLPAFYNFYVLYKKAHEHGWAIFIPIYGNVVYARIAQKPIELGVFMALATAVTFGGESVIVPIIEWAVWAVLGLTIYSGFVKVYKAKNYQWVLLILLPLAASFMVKDFVFVGVPRNKKSKKRQPNNWSNLS